MQGNSYGIRLCWLLLGSAGLVACGSDIPDNVEVQNTGAAPGTMVVAPATSTAEANDSGTTVGQTSAGPSVTPPAAAGNAGMITGVMPADTSEPAPAPVTGAPADDITAPTVPAGGDPATEPAGQPDGTMDVDPTMSMAGMMATAAPAGPRDFEAEGVPVIVDKNVGKGFEATVASSDTGDGSGCSGFVSLFGQDPEQSAEYIKIPADLDMRLYSVYRPEVLEEGKQYPIATWGNGTCSLPDGQGPFLRQVASHGIIVIAGHSRQVGTTGVMGKALDWAFAANEDPESPYYQKFDLENVGAFGHSQGGATTATVTNSDARIKVAVLLNGGTSTRKPFLAISGDRDLGGGISGYQRAATGASALPAGYLWFHDIPGSGSLDGHLTLITEPARVAPFVAAWFRYTLADDAEAGEWLKAGQCEVCGNFEYEARGIE